MDIEKFKSILKAKQAELVTRASNIKGESERARSTDFADKVAERENDEVLKNMEHRTVIELAEVNDALKRIKTGDYGYCMRCGLEISEGRLRALSFAKYCRDCAS